MIENKEIYFFLSGGAANMLGVSPNADKSVYSIPLEDSPSTRQGFGRVALSRSLPILNCSFNIQVRRAPSSVIIVVS